MRNASTTDKTAQIVQALKGTHLKHVSKVEWYDDDTDTWSEIDDIDGGKQIKVRGQSKRTKYANVNFTPIATSAGFSVLSRNGEYSPKAGTAKSDILTKNRQVRISLGYKLPSITEVDINLSSGYYYYSEYASSALKTDSDNSEQNTSYFFNNEFLPLYDSVFYDSETYTPAAFACYAYDTNSLTEPFLRQIEVAANTDKVAVFYGWTDTADDNERINSGNFTYAGKTVDGVSKFTISTGTQARYFQVIFIFDAVDWAGGENVTALQIDFDELPPEYFTVFNGFLDDPVFVEPSDGSMPYVNCTARDAWKRAIEIDINLSDVVNEGLDDILKNVFDKIGIAYTSSSIANLGSFGLYNFSDGYGGTVKAETIINDIMIIIQNGASDYQKYSLWIDNDIAYLQETPILTEAVGVLDYRHYIQANKSEDSGRQIQFYRILNSEKQLDKEEELDSVTDSGTKSVSLTWVGKAYITNITVTPSTEWENISLTSIENEQATFQLTGAGSTTIKVYGCKVTDPTGLVMGQAGNLNNILNKDGAALQQIIPFTDTDANARSSAEGVVEIFGDPTKTAGIQYPYLYLLPEINDPLLIWSRYFYEDDIYFVIGYEHTAVLERMETKLFLLDSKRSFGIDIDYDESHVYDKGIKYEMRLGPQGTIDDIDPADYKKNIGVL